MNLLSALPLSQLPKSPVGFGFLDRKEIGSVAEILKHKIW